jgi:ABC-type dipeptide/oligopeptide/nickel transport system ATPase component
MSNEAMNNAVMNDPVMSNPVMQVNLSAGYGTGANAKSILSGLRFQLGAGEALGLVGTSGAGKTTLVMALLGLLPWRGGRVNGEVLIDDRNLLAMSSGEARHLRGKKVALVPQSPMTALNSAVSLRAHFDEAWRAHESSGSSGRRELDARIEQLMAEVQLPAGTGFLRARPGQISVGQAQRVLIALALLHRPAILIADEPTSALDPVTQAEIVKLLQRLNRQHGTALLYISHDLVSVVQLCHRIAVLHAGSIAECLDVERIENAQHPVTLALLNALPVPPRVLLEHRGAEPSRFTVVPSSFQTLSHSDSPEPAPPNGSQDLGRTEVRTNAPAVRKNPAFV